MNNNENESTSKNELLEAALDYCRRGWSIIPIVRNKKPLGAWRNYQSVRADEATIREWFAKPRVRGLAVVLGKVSGGLACRDFDEVAAYERWAAEHPDDAKRLPTVRTPRAYHVYFRGDVPATRKIGTEGELRGERAYVILPPSVNDSGVLYEWLVPLGSSIPEADPVQIGLAPEIKQQPQHQPLPAISNQGIGDSGPQGRHTETLRVGSEKPVIPDELIVRGSGEHDAKTMDFARFLKYDLMLGLDASLPYFRDWHEQGKRYMSEPDPELGWFKFERAYLSARIPRGSSPAREAMERVRKGPQPAIAMQYDSPKTRLLVALLYELDKRAPGKVIVLSSHLAGDLIETDQKIAYDALWKLVRDGVIENVTRGKQGHGGRPNTASRWRWIGGDGATT